MAGPRALGDHVVPVIGKAAAGAGRPAPRVVAGLIVHVTGDGAAARRRIDEQFAMAGRVSGYRSMLELEGAAGPGDVAAVGDEAAVERQIRRIADAGATDVLAVPFGSDDEQVRAITAVAEIARTLR
jgi:alkanesulfonate monooxygenase SsuD/methylene tetrahydromethanopterin reductase-like flavin-dependent oxidoreductase (luciferase family)